MDTAGEVTLEDSEAEAAEPGERAVAKQINCVLYTGASLLAAVSPEAGLVMQFVEIDSSDCGAESEFEGETCSLCFAAGTPVHTNHGDIPIEKLEVGDEVLARNDRTGAEEHEPVTALTAPHKDKLLEIRVEGERTPLRPSTHHPFWVERGDASARWLNSGDLRVGDRLLTIGGTWRAITAITPVEGQETVYNFTVDKDHDYFVGETGFLVHNANCNCGPLDDLPRYLQYWENLTGRAPEQSGPYNIINRYDGGGNLTGATTYDGFGNRAFQYEFPDNTRHGPGFHKYDNEGPNMGCGKGPRSLHIPF